MDPPPALEPPPAPPPMLALANGEAPPPPPQVEAIKPLAPSLVTLKRAVKKEMKILALEHKTGSFDGNTTKGSMIPSGFRLDSPRSHGSESRSDAMTANDD